MKYLTLALFCLLGNQLVYSQDIAVEGGYKNLQTNRFQIGISYRLSNVYSAYSTNISSFVITDFSNKNSIGIAVNQRIKRDFEISGTISNRYIEPTIGFNLANFVKLNVGYSISKNQNYEGVTFGLLFAIGKKNYYDYIKLGF